MGLLEGKTALIFGLANDKSIAWGITQAFHREGANIGISYAGEMLERRVKPLAEKVGCQWVEECDVTKDDQISAVAEKAAQHFGKIDVLVHSIAFAGRDECARHFGIFICRVDQRIPLDVESGSFCDVSHLLWLGESRATL